MSLFFKSLQCYEGMFFSGTVYAAELGDKGCGEARSPAAWAGCPSSFSGSTKRKPEPHHTPVPTQGSACCPNMRAWVQIPGISIETIAAHAHTPHACTCTHVHTQSAHTVYKQSSGNRNSEISLYVSFVPCVLQLLTDQLGILNEGKRGGIVHGQRACQEWSVCLTVRLVFSLCASLWSCGHPMPF